MACVMNWFSIFDYYLDSENFLLESGLSYFKVMFLLVCFVSAVRCHCFDLLEETNINLASKMNTVA